GRNMTYNMIHLHPIAASVDHVVGHVAAVLRARDAEDVEELLPRGDRGRDAALAGGLARRGLLELLHRKRAERVRPVLRRRNFDVADEVHAGGAAAVVP